MAMTWPAPCKVISQGYGDKNSRYEKGYHTGIDIACINGSPIRAAIDGVVSFAGQTAAYGNEIKITQGSMTTLYGHLSRISVQQGQNVSAGTIIGNEGSTGNSTGPHLHFEVQINGADTDPMPYLSGSKPIPAEGSTVNPAIANAQQVGAWTDIKGVAKAASWLTDTGNWLRIGMAIGGALCIYIGVVGLARAKVMGALVAQKALKGDSA